MKGIRHLADHLDISIGTVSRALNGRPDVKEETRNRVLEAARKLGYVPNQSGRSLRQGTTNIIGFMIQTGTEINGQGDTFFMSVFDGVQEVFARHKLDLVALLCSSQEDPAEYLRRAVARGFADGLILSATQRQDARVQLLAERNIPFVTLGRTLTDAGQPWLDLDFEGMAQASIDRLVARGHRRIAITRPHDDANLGYIFVERCREALAAHGLTLEEKLVFRSTPNEAGGYQIGRDLLALEERPTAIVLINETIAIGLYRALSEAGVRPGSDIAVIGRHSPHAHFLSPSLTCFRLSLHDLGIALAETLLSSMPAFTQHYPDAPVNRLWPMELVDGESDAFRAHKS
ncbi:LacI family DNA-binding transcriptional regulator [Sinorhizobium alkalisoli]|uniref:LacI family transcriptional regulator n=1 Tax=Sinorhizobium alkalisoli TaxID=1752398 RepID=A0A1E3V7I4_9HYPH|nr:LacI family DNA-binding transcriptional regulator [Sinorhizobium alkalisoli]MCA1490432.1 LacI family DNA-binding transcriptional regulator [Ensifer sp. NBAIM29]MCG5480353.1 LacI family DNA-binding transcriptional regulator [Sinorhizobium alkalisoli]ODR89592.1 LacI family transcriptional regulator [Sinorhizobium alkalisoli]QFI69828.1 putative HTH transcriptional regulator [Sinorhizobium alkalisoli]